LPRVAIPRAPPEFCQISAWTVCPASTFMVVETREDVLPSAGEVSAAWTSESATATPATNARMTRRPVVFGAHNTWALNW